MQLLSSVRYREVDWGLLVISLILSAVGVAFIYSACLDPSAPRGWGREAEMQLIWLAIGICACALCLHVPARTWYQMALPLLLLSLGLQAVVLVAGGTPLVPVINGRSSWIVLGPLRIQPDEFVKIATLLAIARVASDPMADLRQASWVFLTCMVWFIPVAPILSNNLGNALPLVPTLAALLLLAGIRLRVLLGLCATGMLSLFLVVLSLPQEGSRSYMWRRIQAWMHPEDYMLTEAFQVQRALRSIGSGQLFGKGYAVGDQNLLGLVPEKHTDMILSVIGEEMGFVGSSLTVLLFLVFACIGYWSTLSARDHFSRLLIGSFTSLIVFQAFLNIAVVLELMPVTGVTLPFLSYGGSSLLASYIGIGICLSCSLARTEHFSKRILDE